MKQSQSGISLVEVLIVLAIIAVIATPAVISSGAPDRSGRADTEARQLAVRLSLAADRAVTSGQAIRMVWDETAYEFALSEGPDGPAPGAGRRTLPRSLRLSGDMAGEVMIGPDYPYVSVWRITGHGDAATIEFDGLGARVVPRGE